MHIQKKLCSEKFTLLPGLTNLLTCMALCVVSALNSQAIQSEAYSSTAKYECWPFFWKPCWNYIHWEQNEMGRKKKTTVTFKKRRVFSVLLSVCECRQVFAFSFWQKWQSPLSWTPAWYQPTPEQPRATPPQHKAHLARKGAAAERHSQGRRAGDRLKGPRRRGRQHDESWCVRHVSLSLSLSLGPAPLLPALPIPPPPPFFWRVAARLVWKACERVLTEQDSPVGNGVSSHLTDPHRVPLPLLGPPCPPPVMQTGF